MLCGKIELLSSRSRSQLWCVFFYNQTFNMTLSSELMILLQPNLVWWEIITGQSVQCKCWIDVFQVNITVNIQNFSLCFALTISSEPVFHWNLPVSPRLFHLDLLVSLGLFHVDWNSIQHFVKSEWMVVGFQSLSVWQKMMFFLDVGSVVSCSKTVRRLHACCDVIVNMWW